jgi:hypothetical protein
MPDINWQLIVVLAAVAGAACFLIHRGLKSMRSGKQSATPCGSCRSCAPPPDATAAPPTAFVPLESLTRNDRT